LYHRYVAAEGKPATLPFRIKHTMKRALHAIFVTSFTTSAAFLGGAVQVESS
jgi:hypothetical protein